MPVTLRDIAKELGLSHVTVSLVLNNRRDVAITDATRERVIEMARDMGYRPNHAARSLSLGRTQMIAVWMPSLAKLYYGKIFDILYARCRNLGYETVFCLADYADPSRKPYDWPVDGIVAVDTYELVGKYELPVGIPVVSIGAYPELRSDSVTVDIYSGAKLGTAHLIDAGCRRIAHVTTAKPLSEPRGRSAAYTSTMKGANLKPEIVTCEPGGAAKVREAVAKHIQKSGLPGGFFCYSDEFAFATMRAVADLGFQPGKDVKVVGFDNVSEAEFSTPSLTTVAQPIEQMCQIGMQFLYNRITDPTLARQEASMGMTLIKRESTRVSQ